ncbi:MAG: hypothetical protein ACHQ1D_11495 [Nitrososphaerales archaeon]
MIEFYSVLKERANTTHLWCPIDTEENYKIYHKDLKSLNPYKPGDFTYVFNDHGLRCDNFTLPSDINIVFLGCSVTEGIGLPVEDTWSYQLLSKIRQKTNKNIPYWCLALGGTGIDTQSSLLHWFSKINKIDYVFSLIPSLSRREYLFNNNNNIQYWNIYLKNRILIDELFCDDNYQFYETYRSLMIIESIISNRAIMHCTSWDTSESRDIFYKKELNSLNYFPSVIQTTEHARDGCHPGPTYHKKLANIFWDKVEHLFNP